MGVNYLVISAACTVVSFIGLWCWTDISLEKLKLDGLITENALDLANASCIFKLLLGSHATLILLAISLINAFLLSTLCLKSIFFGELYASEIQKSVARLAKYIFYKGIFLPLIIPPSIFQASMWFTWLTVLCLLKMFQALARDRLERLNASPSATSWTYIRVYSALLLVLIVDILWIWYCVAVLGPLVSTSYWLLFFEPLSLAFGTLQAMALHGFHLIDIWIYRSDCQRSKLLDSTSGLLWEWKSNAVRNMGFFLDMMARFMALGHHLLIWRLHGTAFQLMDAILFLNIQALLSTILKRVKGFMKLKRALGALHNALPDATSKEIQVYDDECAICREPMAKAKRLPCKHLFHLSCLKSWLDQSLTGNYSCPTCRKSLFLARSQNEPSSNSRALSSDEQLAHRLRARPRLPNAGGLGGTSPDLNRNSIEAGTWRGAGADVNRLQRWPSEGLDGAGPSTNIGSSGGLGRVQMVMSYLATVGDSPWSLWPGSTSQAGATFSTAAQRSTATTAHRRVASNPANESNLNLLAMAETVREVLPHVPFEDFLQDLQRTHSVAATITNFLQM